jgi:hypothetical protein
MNLKIEATKTMPAVTFNDGILSIVGRSIPHNSELLYNPLLMVLFNYSQNPNRSTEINIKLEYLNSDSNRSLMNVLIIAEKMHRRGNKVVIKWYYKNNDNLMFDQGNIFKSLIEVPFNFVPVN